MSYHSPRRQPLSLVQNKSNSTAGSSSNASTAGGASPASLKSRKLPSMSALTSLHTSPKASLETSREGRASLSFIPFTSPGSSSTSSTSARSSSETTSGKLRARATTFSASSLNTSIYPSTSSSIRSPPHTATTPSALGPARRTRSKTLSKSQSRPVNQHNNTVLHTRKALSQDDRRHSCTFVENDNLQRTLDLLEQHVEEQSRRLSLSSSSSAAAAVSPASAGCVPASNAASPMLSAPLMQRTPTSNPVLYPGPASSLSWSNGSSAHQQPIQQLSPPVLLPPYIAPDLDLVYPTSTNVNNAQASSTSPSKQAALSPQVERLSNLINDLSLFLPRADSLSSDQVHALQNAVDSILGKTAKPSTASAFISSATTHLGNAIQLKHDNVNNIFADDMPTFYVGVPSIMHNAPGYPANNTNLSALQASQTLYDPSTPSEDTDMLGASTKSNTSSIASLERNIGGIELQVQHNPPPYESRINFASFDNDLELVPPRW